MQANFNKDAYGHSVDFKRRQKKLKDTKPQIKIYSFQILFTSLHLNNQTVSGQPILSTCCFALFDSFSMSVRMWRRLACENIRFSSLFAAGDVSRGGTSATQWQKFHTDDANQCLHNKSGSHGVPNINLSNFTCLLVDFEKTIFHKY